MKGKECQVPTGPLGEGGETQEPPRAVQDPLRATQEPPRPLLTIKNVCFSLRFPILFVDSHFGSKSGQETLKRIPRAPQSNPRVTQEGPRAAQEWPKSGPRAAKSEPKSDQERPKSGQETSWVDLERKKPPRDPIYTHARAIWSTTEYMRTWHAHARAPGLQRQKSTHGPPRCPPRPPKNTPRTPKTPPRPPKTSPKRLQDHPKRLPRAPQEASQSLPRPPQAAPKMHPEDLRGRISPRSNLLFKYSQSYLIYHTLMYWKFSRNRQQHPRTFQDQHIGASELPSLPASEPPSACREAQTICCEAAGEK